MRIVLSVHQAFGTILITIPIGRVTANSSWVWPQEWCDEAYFSGERLHHAPMSHAVLLNPESWVAFRDSLRGLIVLLLSSRTLQRRQVMLLLIRACSKAKAEQWNIPKDCSFTMLVPGELYLLGAWKWQQYLSLDFLVSWPRRRTFMLLMSHFGWLP